MEGFPRVNRFEWPLRCIPNVLLGGRFPMPASNSGKQYLNGHYALHQYLYSGEVVIGKRNFEFRNGDLTITPPGVPTVYDLPEGGTHWCINFEPVYLLKEQSVFRLPLYLPALGAAAHFGERLRAIADTLRPRKRCKREKELASVSAGVQLQEVLLLLARYRSAQEINQPSSRRSDMALDGIKEEMELHFQRPFNIATLAASSGLSRNFFAARFRERFGMTAGGYLLHLRMEMAKNLLLSTTQSIKEVAYETGIPDPHYFNKQFRRVVGMSPSLYRTRNRD